MKIFDTVAAVSTPYGKGGIAVIRISGPDALSVGDRVFRPKSGKKLSEGEPCRMVYGEILKQTTDGNTVCIDDGMAVYFRAPRSFTGEDTVEISCHGGILITSAVLEAVLAAGAGMAQPGEFTRRAFISGKIGLTQAEALGNLLDAGNDNQLLLARNGMKGILSSETEALYNSLRGILSNIYAAIDFPDEDLSGMSREEMRSAAENVRSAVQKLSGTYRTGRAVAEGIPTVICGRTNVGKSSVYNRLVGHDAAIVTDIEGTTRDLLKETAVVGGVTLRLCDTAGLRKTDDKVENIGIDRAVEALENSELVLAVFDASRKQDKDDKSLIYYLTGNSSPRRTVIAVLNKSDIGADRETVEAIENSFEYTVSVSARTSEGFSELSELISRLFIDGSISISEDAVVTNARQYAALTRALSSLDRALSAIDNGTSLDLCCIDIEEAMQSLGEIDGREVGEDIVSEIFAKFCVGK